MAATIWCLFSVENEYDQPDHNLVVWWKERPSIEVLAAALNVTLGKDDLQTVAVVNIWTGSRAIIGDTTSYRLEQTTEGTTLS